MTSWICSSCRLAKLCTSRKSVSIHRVIDPRDARAWQPSEDGDVLLLGDSFSNIYCTPELGWGDAAGLPAQLARFLERDVDVIARNGSAATATRRELAPPKPSRFAGRDAWWSGNSPRGS